MQADDLLRIGGADGHPLRVGLEPGTYDAFRVALTGEDCILNFDEFQAWASTDGMPVNVALEGTANLSSTWRPSFSADTGHDGNITGGCGPHTEKQTDPSWTIELDRARPVESLVLYTRLRFHPERTSHLTIEARRGTTWTKVFDQTDPDLVRATLGRMLASTASEIDAVLNAGHRVLTESTLVLDVDNGDLHPQFEQLHALHDLRRLIDGLAPGGLGKANELLEIPSASQLTAIEVALSAILRSSQHSGLGAAWPAMIDASGHDDLVVRGSHSFKLARFEVTTPEPSTRVMPDPIAAMSGHLLGDQLTDIGVLPGHDGHLLITPPSGSAKRVAKKWTGKRWEVWGTSPGKPRVLLFASDLVERSVASVQYALSELSGQRTFDGLSNLLACAETRGEYWAAHLLSTTYAVPEPTAPQKATYLARVDVHSGAAHHRKSVSRTKHGYRTSFRFKSKPAHATGMRTIIDQLAEIGVEAVPAYGTLLGMAREGTFIEHDDDLDLILISPLTAESDIPAYMDELKTKLRERTGWRVWNSDLPAKNTPVGFKVDGHYVHCDLFPTFQEGSNLMFFDHSRGARFRPLDRHWFDAGDTVTVEGVDFVMPKGFESILRETYGPKWMQPDPNYKLGFKWSDG